MARNPNLPRRQNPNTGGSQTIPEIRLGAPIDLPDRPDDGLAYPLEQVHFKDAEILGKSFRVRRTIDQSVTSSLNQVDKRRAQIGNTLSTPKNLYLQWKAERADAKYHRKLTKVGTSHFKFRNNHHQKVANKHLAKRNAAENRRDKHTQMMTERTALSQQTRQQRMERHRALVDQHIAHKTAAEGRREIRRQSRELRRQGISRQEVQRRLGLDQRSGESDQEYMKRRSDYQQHLGTIACVRAQSEHSVHKAEHRYDKTVKKIDNLETKKQTLTESIRGTHTFIHESTAKLAESKQRGIDLHAEITALADQLAEHAPEDPEYADISARMAAAKTAYDELRTQYEEDKRAHALAREKLARMMTAHATVIRKKSTAESKRHAHQQAFFRAERDKARNEHRLDVLDQQFAYTHQPKPAAQPQQPGGTS